MLGESKKSHNLTENITGLWTQNTAHYKKLPNCSECTSSIGKVLNSRIELTREMLQINRITAQSNAIVLRYFRRVTLNKQVNNKDFKIAQI